MGDKETKAEIIAVLGRFEGGNLARNATRLFDVLGYRSEKTVELEPRSYAGLQPLFDLQRQLNLADALVDEWRSVDVVFQLTDEEVRNAGPQGHFVFESRNIVDNALIQSYLIFAIELRGPTYTRTQLARATRALNKLFRMPVLILFKHSATLTLAIIDRRLSRVDADKDVLEKVTLIKDIAYALPHRAHIEILFDLSLPQLQAQHNPTNFVELHKAWQKTLDTSELNKRFFKEVANWYFWAVKIVRFPKDAGPDEETRNATSVIRMITRLIFVWFVKEKGLIPDEMFDRRKLEDVLNWSDPNRSTYYKAILQNLFFATLNREKDRGWSKQSQQTYLVTDLYRYKRYFVNPDTALELFTEVPFLNGGLFDCLDKEDNGKRVWRIDGFSDHPHNELSVPDELFFGEEQNVDLNQIFGTSGKKYSADGLLTIFKNYKFTVDENTPVEEEVALDPELLGRVFENLLANYNEETKITARKQSGSFYTPREIVNYMVDEALIAYLETELGEAQNTAERVRDLVSYDRPMPEFATAEVRRLVDAIDDVKILDPACGSGAFPMGMLHKLVFLLHQLDPQNALWKQKQLGKAQAIDHAETREKAVSDIEQAFERNELDYGRKLYLIENCIFGVDIQTVAVQIARLRFFISLLVDQCEDLGMPNRGIRPLPNLETKFVAANTLLGINRSQQPLRSQAVFEKESELAQVRRSHFGAKSRQQKKLQRERDKALRTELAGLLQEEGLPPATTDKLAEWDPYDQNKVADFFDPEWMFTRKDGFDITIGNPPYVRADSPGQHPELRKAIQDSGAYETLWEKWDLFVAFMEKSYKLLKPGGVTTMIVSDAYCHAKYAVKSQRWFLSHARIIRLDFLSQIQVFEAGVRNITYLFQHADGSENIPLRRLHHPGFGQVRLLPSAWQKSLDERAFFPDDLVAGTKACPTVPLNDICYISVGMVVNADEATAPGAFQMSDVVQEHRDRTHPKPFVEGKNLARWLPTTHRWLEWGTQRAPSQFRRPTSPELHQTKGKILVQRSPGPDPKACLDDIGLHFTESSVGFLLWHDLKGVRNKSLQKVARYANEKRRPDLSHREDLEKTSHRFPIEYLLGIMNSSWARDFLRANRRSNIHLYPEDWKQLPIPDVSADKQQSITDLVDQILMRKRVNAAADVVDFEEQLDAFVSRLYAGE